MSSISALTLRIFHVGLLMYLNGTRVRGEAGRNTNVLIPLDWIRLAVLEEGVIVWHTFEPVLCRHVRPAGHVGHIRQRDVPASDGAVRRAHWSAESTESSSHSWARECPRHSVRRTRGQLGNVRQRRRTGLITSAKFTFRLLLYSPTHSKQVSNTDIAVRNVATPATGTHTLCGITQRYLLPGRPEVTFSLYPSKAGTRFI